MDSDGFSFFVLPGQVAVPEVMLNVDGKGEPLRKRAPHRKSRNGCGNCRRKKIKVRIHGHTASREDLDIHPHHVMTCS